MKTERKTILELDLKDYSGVARDLEDHLSVTEVMKLNDQIQGFVDVALQASALSKDVIVATTGDGAILMFDSASQGHVVAEAVHFACRLHNHERKTSASARWFRMGMATGEVAVKTDNGHRKIAGRVIARSVRLESASRVGEIIVDVETYGRLSASQQACYGPEELIKGKRDEIFRARRYVVVTPPSAGVDPGRIRNSDSARRTWIEKLEHLRTSEAISSNPAQKFELGRQIAEAEKKIAEIGD